MADRNAEASVPRLLKISQLAQYASVSEKTIRREIAAGVLPCFRFGNRGIIRFRVSDVEKWLAARAVPVTPGGES